MTIQANHLSRIKPIAIAASVFVLAGCATFSKDGGLDAVSTLTKERTGQTVQRVSPDNDSNATDKTVDELLAKPLTPDSAVQIALMNNKGLQVSLAELGVAESFLVQAGRIANPRFSFARFAGGGEVEYERGIMFSLVGLLTMPVRVNIERNLFERAKLQAASDAVTLAADARRAYFNAVAAQQSAKYMEQVKESAEAAVELAQRMAKVGNFTRLDYTREQAFYADSIAQLAAARHSATAAREQLTRLLGLWGKRTAFQLPDRLPDLPKAPTEMKDIESLAMKQRLDVQMAKREAESTARSLGLTRATSFINVTDLDYTIRRENDDPRERGYEITLELPLFDFGGAKRTMAESIYMQSVHRTADTAVRARSEVREAYSAYRTSYDLAKHYRDEIVPLRQKISEEMMLRYNGMLVSVFELLADSREQVNSVNAAIEAQRNYWLTDTDLQMAVNGTGGSVTVTAGRASTAEAAPAGH